MSDPSYLLAMRNELILHFPPLHELVISRPWLLCYGKYRPSKIKLHVQNTKDEFNLFKSWQIWPFMYALNKFTVNISTSDLTIQYYFIASIITTPDLDPPKPVHLLTLIFAISGLFIKNKSRFLINVIIITNQLKFNYNLRTLSTRCWNTKGVRSFSGADKTPKTL